VRTPDALLLLRALRAQRVLELLKELPEFNRGCRVAKLFSRHIKPEEQAELLAAAPVCIAVGTPARIDKLVAMGALSLGRCSLLVLDCQRDVKQRSLLDIAETKRDTWQLWRAHLATRIAAGDTRVALV
jgi:protein CMS1